MDAPIRATWPGPIRCPVSSKPRRDQNFSGRRLSPNFGGSRLPETKFRKSPVEQAALTRAFLAKALQSEIRGTAWWAREDSNLQPDRYERSSLPIELLALHVPSIDARM